MLDGSNVQRPLVSADTAGGSAMDAEVNAHKASTAAITGARTRSRDRDVEHDGICAQCNARGNGEIETCPALERTAPPTDCRSTQRRASQCRQCGCCARAHLR